jgi:hypothetical protein
LPPDLFSKSFAIKLNNIDTQQSIPCNTQRGMLSQDLSLGALHQEQVYHQVRFSTIKLVTVKNDFNPKD